MSDVEYLTVPEIAGKTGRHQKVIRRAIDRGELAAERLFGRVLVPVEEWERYRREQRVEPRRRAPRAPRAPRPRAAAREMSTPGSLARLRAIEEASAG